MLGWYSSWSGRELCPQISHIILPGSPLHGVEMNAPFLYFPPASPADDTVRDFTDVESCSLERADHIRVGRVNHSCLLLRVE